MHLKKCILETNETENVLCCQTLFLRNLRLWRWQPLTLLFLAAPQPRDGKQAHMPAHVPGPAEWRWCFMEQYANE